MSRATLYRRMGFLAPLLVLGLAACGGGDGDLASDSAAVREAAERLAERDDGRPAASDEEAVAETREAPAAGAREREDAERAPARPPSGGRSAAEPSADEPASGADQPRPTGDEETPAEPELVTVPAGTSFRAALGRELSTRSVAVGDTFTATLEAGLEAGGATAVPTGAVLHGEVTAVQESGGAGETAILKLNFSRIVFSGDSYPVAASIVQAHPESRSRTTTGEAAGKIGGGAAAGAILGRIIGGDTKGAVIGAAVGAAAGTAVVLGTQDVDAVLPAGSLLELRLDEPLVVKASS